jgi:DNA-binding LacI/PurR family transcriptional regulator
MSITIYEVAEKAGVSAATVSRVLNEYPFVSDSVRKKVQKTIEETQFTPNPHARMMRRGTSVLVGEIHQS